MAGHAIPYQQMHEIAARFGIPLAKGQFVDVADEAVDFIGRTGGFPISLTLVSEPSEHADRVVHALEDPEQIRHAFARLAARLPEFPGGRILARREVGGQRQLVLRGYLDDADRKMVELSAPARAGGGREVIADPLPVYADEAYAMATALRDKHAVPTEDHIVRALADLIVSAAKMFEKTPITGFLFDPLQLAPAGVEVLAASMESAKRLARQPRKMGRRERDRKGYYTPSSDGPTRIIRPKPFGNAGS